MSYLQNCKMTGEFFEGFPVRKFDSIKSVILSIEEMEALRENTSKEDWIHGLRTIVYAKEVTSKRYFPLNDYGINSLHAWGYLHGVWILVNPPAYKEEDGSWHDKPTLSNCVAVNTTEVSQ